MRPPSAEWKFSRWMPPAPDRPVTIAGWLFLVGLFAAPVAATIAWPILVGVGLAVIAGSTIVDHYHNRHLRRLAAARAGEDIGSFARAFDRRTAPFDPWVLRATWDALAPYVMFRGGRLPLRPTDRLMDDLCIDSDDLELDVVEGIAERSGHLLDQPEANPLFGHVETVADIVWFVTLQPRVPARRQGQALSQIVDRDKISG